MFYIIEDINIYVLNRPNDQNMLFKHGKIDEYWTTKKSYKNGVLVTRL